MSFGFGSGSSGFGQQNNQQQSTGFGGFGANNNTTTPAFGANATTTGFGANTSNAGGGLFGNTATGGFGNNGATGFGATNNTSLGFGAKPAFGAPAQTTSLFGGTSAPAASPSTFGGGFGTTNNAASPFGGNTGATMFGAKPASTGFGSPASSTGFSAAPTTTAFGFGANNAATLGGNVGECQGTGAVPFQAFQEKEPNSTSNQQNAFQSICFQQPYQKFSHEELRLADYAQGRRSGNGTAGATGAFGATNFGGFGNTNSTGFGAANNTATNTGGLFGANTTPAQTGFGQPAAATTGAFGASTGTGMFGQAAKPAFGSNAATPAAGSIFGGGSTGFGAAATTNTGFGASTGSSMFGNNNNASKPAFSFPSTNTSSVGGFGQAAAPATGGFGASTNTGFGSTQAQPATNPFGNTTAQPATSGFGGFGAANTAQQPSATPSLFGAAKPATSLFGAAPATTNTGSGMFGGNNNQAANNPFQTSQNNTGTLFGAAKPATGLFQPAGGANTNTFGGFGSNAQAQPQQNSNNLFGGLNTNNNEQPKPSLFNTSGFGNTNNNNSGFGNSNAQLGNSFNQSNNQFQQPQMNNSIFGNNSMAAQQQGLTASINDPAAFGTSLFSNLGSTQVADPGPIATPLSSLSKQKKPGVIPMYKLNPASSASRFSTPGQKRGFGFSYNSYGTPGSHTSSLTNSPLNMGGSVLGGSMSGNRLTQSMSLGNMRSSMGSFSTREDSILAPGAFSASPSRGGSTGSMKKLVINRGIRTDLFQPPSKQSGQLSPGSPNSQHSILKKRVSFEPRNAGNSNGQDSSSSKQTNGGSTGDDNDQSQRATASEAEKSRNNTTSSDSNDTSEMEQVKGNEVAVVSEDGPASDSSANKAGIYNHSDQEPGEYWMLPTKKEIEGMNRVQRQKVTNFTIGRRGVGKVTFLVPVDLTSINMDDLFDKDVCLEVRSATVYPNSATKPPVGRGLNVPSKIELENSWPRFKDKRPIGNKENQAKLKKHIDRLGRVAGTQFVDYNKDNGTWTFTVEHFTRYGIEYSDDDEVEGNTDFEESELSPPPDTPTPANKTPTSAIETGSYVSESEADGSSPEDTFSFKKKKHLPGGFDDQLALFATQDEDMEDDDQSFLDDRSMGSQSENGIDEPMDQDDDSFGNRELVRIEDESADDFEGSDVTMERDAKYATDDDRAEVNTNTSGFISRIRDRAQKVSNTPSKQALQLDNDDWTNMLQRTVSPRKQDRRQLREMAEANEDDMTHDHGDDSSPSKPRLNMIADGKGFTTSIDLMRSLYGESTRSPSKPGKSLQEQKGFQWPYQKSDKTSDADMSTMDPNDRAYHDSLRPSWGNNGTLVYAAAGSARDLSKSARRKAGERDGLLVVSKTNIVSARRDIKFASFSDEPPNNLLATQKSLTTITSVGSVPVAKIQQPFQVKDFFTAPQSLDAASSHEKLVWELASILFDTVEIPVDLNSFANAAARLRKDKLSALWQRLVESASSRDAAMAKSNEEKAIACLAGHKVADACKYLLEGGNHHLATLVALIGQNDITKNDVREQLSEWKKSKMLSEFSQPIRTLYELLAGNVSVCDGMKQGPLEDRIDSYIISQRHGLDWRQAFGLRLWYATSPQENLEVAVQQFIEELGNGKETAKPKAWYLEQDVAPIWEDPAQSSREDLLWGLLKLYADPKSDLEAILRPENSQLSPLNIRLSWQLSRALTASNKVAYGNDAAAKQDALTLDFAAQLSSEGNWLDAVFVLIHLTSSSARSRAIQRHLAQHALKIGEEDEEAFQSLTKQLHVPASWIWEAKALCMRQTLINPVKETQYLLKAGSYDEAHRTFTKTVAPQAVVERDYQILRSIIQEFQGKELLVKDWHIGGEIYSDYLVLLNLDKKAEEATLNIVMDRLFTSLPVMSNKSDIGFMENVAVQEMSAVLSKAVFENKDKTLKNSKHFSHILKLPLLEDQHLAYTTQMSIAYYEAIMAGTR